LSIRAARRRRLAVAIYNALALLTGRIAPPAEAEIVNASPTVEVDGTEFK